MFQQFTDAIRFTMQQHGFTHLYNYIDDLIYIGLPSEIHKAYSFLMAVLQDLALEISNKKIVSPATSVICLDIHIDTVSRNISIPKKKIT